MSHVQSHQEWNPFLDVPYFDLSISQRRRYDLWGSAVDYFKESLEHYLVLSTTMLDIAHVSCVLDSSRIPYIDVMLALDSFLSRMERSLFGLKLRLSAFIGCERIVFLPGESTTPSPAGWPRHVFESEITEQDMPTLQSMAELIVSHHTNNHMISDYIRTLPSWYTSDETEVVCGCDIVSYFRGRQELEDNVCQSEMLLLQFYMRSSDFQE